jgi:hypothetical protein
MRSFRSGADEKRPVKALSTLSRWPRRQRIEVILAEIGRGVVGQFEGKVIDIGNRDVACSDPSVQHHWMVGLQSRSILPFNQSAAAALTLRPPMAVEYGALTRARSHGTANAISWSTRLKHVASDVIQDSHLVAGVIHCGLKENRDGQAATDGVA